MAEEAGRGRRRLHTSYTTEQELQTLYRIAASCPRGAAALEIGSYLGASTCYLAAGLAKVNGHLVCADTWRNETMGEGERDTFAEFQNNTRGVSRWLTPVRKRSEDLTDADVPGSLDLVFIDGDHGYDAARGDFDLVANRITENGLVAFHDCLYFQGVSRVIGEALATGDWMIGGHVENLLWIKRANWHT